MAIVAINLAVILLLFAGPRIKFLIEYSDKSYKQITETPGPEDLPNQFVKSYQVASTLKKKVDRQRPLFIPINNLEGLTRSVIIQMLFRHNLIFTDDQDFTQQLEGAENAYAVSSNGKKNELCAGVKGESLGGTGFVLCQVN